MSYRVEVSTTNRAGCQNAECKKQGIKINKGELREGVLVDFQGNQTWKWKHWGCVTPNVLNNWAETSGMNMELVDGFDTLPDELQAKVRRALEQRHVEDDEWNGDIEMNRLGEGTGGRMRLTAAMKKKLGKDQEDAASGDDDAVAEKKPTKKRGRAKKDADAEEDSGDGEQPAPKKARGKGKKATKADDGEGAQDDNAAKAPTAKKTTEKPAKKTRKPKETVENDEPEKSASKVEALPKKIKTKGKAIKASKPPPQMDSADDSEAPEEKPAPKKGRGKKTAAKAPDADEEPTAVKPRTSGRRTRGSKAAADEKD